METQAQINYERVAEAITYIREHFKEQPTLETIAEKVHLSPYHFQRLFSDWAGTSPKKFLQYTSLEHAKKLLKEEQATLFDTAMETGLSGTSRLHDLFINIEGMTPAEYKNGGEQLSINYSFARSPFGQFLVASTPKGICHLAFHDKEEDAVAQLYARFPKAAFRQLSDPLQKGAVSIFQDGGNTLQKIKLHLKGSDFQLKVWEALLKIPRGRLVSYGAIAHLINRPKASRAVGSAIGSNPIAYLIPCHRVILNDGNYGNYHWGSTRKLAMIGWEAVKTEV